MPKNFVTESLKSFVWAPKHFLKRNFQLKNLFPFKSFLCTSSMQFPPNRRNFSPAVWKIPAQRAKLNVKTYFFSTTKSVLKEWLWNRTRQLWRPILKLFVQNSKRILLFDFFFEKKHLPSKCRRVHLQCSSDKNSR